MSLLGKILGTNTNRTSGAIMYYAPTQKVASPAMYKTAGYASIPYERAPKVTDTVPTKGLLPGYCTPENVWVA